MSTRTVSLVAAIAAIAALAAVMPAGAVTPAPAKVAAVGIEVAKLGLAVDAIDKATSSCKTRACLSKSYASYYAQARTVDHALEALWIAAGRSGACASAAATAAAGFDSLTTDYHHLEAATLKSDKAAATSAYGQIQAKTPRLTAVIGSFKTKCR